jgi:hypothetical protein
MTLRCKPGQLARIGGPNLIPPAEFARGWIIQVTELDNRFTAPFWKYSGTLHKFPNGEEIISFADNILIPIPGLDQLEGEDEMVTIMKNKTSREEVDKIELVEHS